MRTSRPHMLLVVTLALVVVAPQPGFAQLGKRTAQDWLARLETADRIAGMKISETIPRLDLKPGDHVADIGAGTGLYSIPLAKAVPSGRVFAVDIDQDLLDIIQDKAKKENVSNVEVVLGDFDDPKLSSRQVDVAFFNDVLHHIEHRELYLKNLARYLKPNARIVVIDLLRGHQNEPEMQIKLDQVKQWMLGVGFQMTAEVTDLYTDKFFAVFARK